MRKRNKSYTIAERKFQRFDTEINVVVFKTLFLASVIFDIV